ncbi:hypothetical protein P7D22_17015 [Lichenihabitans sp. Uapishka_5]|uniref:hypothetical protein n=1 Tax=Lichenihabitans sp. Uapishka_5 TaxID=3037302 RepID=UPI0029E7FD95|nr:hypothetical protein [Lichenihabitans sp. Uapishka_5]MDX7952869.1 hypothetical protein [Lichenihabitans sp. Uapishka_5]
MTDGMPRIMTTRLAVAAAFRSASRRHHVSHVSIGYLLECWACERTSTEALAWPGPPRDIDEGIRRREACTAAIRESKRQGDPLPGEILQCMVEWSWNR